MAQAKAKTGNDKLTMADLTRDVDVVDTWFSSWLWPIAVFDGFEHQEELKYYYPTNALVTGWDIMFFWVARMIMAGYEWSEDLLGKETVIAKGRQPFNDVYFTGMVRDNQRRKMSKSLGNSPDALQLIENYGADGVRFGMLFSGSAGNDIVFDAPFDKKTKKALNESNLCNQGTKFCNKLWNAQKLVGLFKVAEISAEQQALNQLSVNWMENKLNSVIADINQKYETYRLSDILETLYNFIWNDFFSWYLEMTKNVSIVDKLAINYTDQATMDKTTEIFEKLMTVLHPFMPFITEEIWHQLRERKDGEDCVISAYPKAAAFDKKAIDLVEAAKDIVSNIRDVRNKNQLNKEPIAFFVQSSDKAKAMFDTAGVQEMISKLGILKSFAFTDKEPENTVSFISGTDKFFVQLNKTIDKDAEKARIEKELAHAKGFVTGIERKLSNERFVNNAPAVVIDKERKKLADGQERVRNLEESLVKL